MELVCDHLDTTNLTINNMLQYDQFLIKEIKNTDDEYVNLMNNCNANNTNNTNNTKHVHNLNDLHNLTMVLDVETTGFPDKLGFYGYYNYTNTSKYDNARIIQLSWGLYDDIGNLLKLVDLIVKPNGFIIKNDDIHGITNEFANNEGNDIKIIFKKLLTDLKKTSTIVGHNLMFDENVILSELHRNKFNLTIDEFKKKKKCCTGLGTEQLLKIKLEHGKYKMPTLQELYFWCFKENIAITHNSKYDVINTAKCYFYIKNNI